MSDRDAVESLVARRTVSRSVYVAPVLIIVFWLIRGWPGAWSAALGIGVVAANLLLAGAILSVSARISPTVYHAAALFGFFLRLGLITLTMILLARMLPDLDRLAFGLAAVIAYLGLLTWETLAEAKGHERSLDWIS